MSLYFSIKQMTLMEVRCKLNDCNGNIQSLRTWLDSAIETINEEVKREGEILNEENKDQDWEDE